MSKWALVVLNKSSKFYKNSKNPGQYYFFWHHQSKELYSRYLISKAVTFDPFLKVHSQQCEGTL